MATLAIEIWGGMLVGAFCDVPLPVDLDVVLVDHDSAQYGDDFDGHRVTLPDGATVAVLPAPDVEPLEPQMLAVLAAARD